MAIGVLRNFLVISCKLALIKDFIRSVKSGKLRQNSSYYLFNADFATYTLSWSGGSVMEVLLGREGKG